MFTYNPRTRMGVGGRGWGMRRGIDGWSALNESWRENEKVGERMKVPLFGSSVCSYYGGSGCPYFGGFSSGCPYFDSLAPGALILTAWLQVPLFWRLRLVAKYKDLNIISIPQIIFMCITVYLSCAVVRLYR